MLAREIEDRARKGQQISVPDLAEATGRTRDALYRAAKRGELRAIYLGRRPMILPEEALRLIGAADVQGPGGVG